MGKSRIDRKLVLMCVVLALAVVGVYWQVWDFGFVRVDDEPHVSGNPYVLAGLGPQSVRWAFVGGSITANWHPLTWLSLMADSELAGVVPWIIDTDLGRGNSGVYHLTNVALHLANTLLLFLLLNAITGARWRSAFVALLFGVHPLHVESVAWISERKDVLSTLFWILTTWAYVQWTRRGDSRNRMLTVVLFALGLMSKPMLVTLPLTLLLLDFWPLGRGNHESTKVRKNESPEPLFAFSSFRAFVIEKVPLFALALGSCIVTFVVQRTEGAVAPTEVFGIGARAANALVSCVRYLWMMVVPRDLAPFYPHPGNGMPWWCAPASAVGLAAVTILAIKLAGRAPYVLVGWLWYLITLVPVIGLVQVGGQAMADRYTYVPLIGIFIMIAWGVPDLVAKCIRPQAIRSAVLGLVAVAIVIGLMLVTWRQVGYWRSDVSIWEHTASVIPNSDRAHYNLGCAYDGAEEPDLAARHYREAVRLNPDRADAQNNLGYVLMRQGCYDAAEPLFVAAIKTAPDLASAHNNLGLVLMHRGRVDDAIAHFRKSVDLNPGDENARGNLNAAEALKGGEGR